MAYQQVDLGLDVRRDPKKARALILDALNASEGMVCESADSLGVSLRSLFRWIALLGLSAHVREMKRQYGQPLRGRRGAHAA